MKVYLIFLIALLAGSTALRAEGFAASVFDGGVLRLYAPQVTVDFPDQFRAATATNPCYGVVLDLRSAGGDTAASTVTNLSFAGKFPLVILVNQATRGPAAALASELRLAGSGVLVGCNEFGGKARPDILVAVPSEDESRFLADPCFVASDLKIPSLAAAREMLPFVDHTSEADLVRRRLKDGEEFTAIPRKEPSRPIVRDPALARALDLLLALKALHPVRR